MLSGADPYTLNIVDQSGRSLSAIPNEDEDVNASYTQDGWVIVDGNGGVSLLSEPDLEPRQIATIPASPTCHGFQVLMQRAHSLIVAVLSGNGPGPCSGDETSTTDIYEVDTDGVQRVLVQLGRGPQPLPPAFMLADNTLFFESDVQNDSCLGLAAGLMEVDLNSGEATPVALPAASSDKIYALGSFWTTGDELTATLAEVGRPSSSASACETPASELREFTYTNGAWSRGDHVDGLSIEGPRGWSMQASGPFVSDGVNVSPAKGSLLSMVGPNGDHRILDRDATQSYLGARWAPAT